MENCCSVVNTTLYCFLLLGLFIDAAADVARKEMAWETDYRREAECAERFR